MLKQHGYHLEHNFGHGQAHLAAVLVMLILLAFLCRTILGVVDAGYRRVREALGARRTLFDDLRALTRYLVFPDWETLLGFVIRGLDLVLSEQRTEHRARGDGVTGRLTRPARLPGAERGRRRTGRCTGARVAGRAQAACRRSVTCRGGAPAGVEPPADRSGPPASRTLGVAAGGSSLLTAIVARQRASSVTHRSGLGRAWAASPVGRWRPRRRASSQRGWALTGRRLVRSTLPESLCAFREGAQIPLDPLHRRLR